jgi:peptide/nickel transport system substrate-binding protein
LVATLLLAGLAGCGDGGAHRFSGAPPIDAGGGGELAYAIASDPLDLDPLRADTPSAQVVARQVFEPLVETLDGPYGAAQGLPGVAFDWEHSGDFRVWSFHLRSSVQFQDETPLDAGAVVANASRWRADPVGRALLPGLLAADAPRPNLVRLILAGPDPRLPARLTDPRLGLVSPPALSDDGSGALERVQQAGTGPFELVRHGPFRVRLGRNREWWGSRLGLGPALDAVTFRVIADPAERAQRLAEGTVRLAGDLPRSIAAGLARDPLIAVAGAAGGSALAFERSVRGITTARPQPLSGAWIVLVAEGG